MADDPEEPARVRLFVGGLASGVTAHDLRATLERLGTIRNVEMVRCKQALQEQEVGRHRGFAYVDYEGAPASLAKLMSVYNGCKWRGGKLRVEKAKEHYLEKLRREWEADVKSEGGAVTAIENEAQIVSEAAPVFNSVSGRRDLRISAHAPGLRILIPDTMKVTIVPLKGSGKHKYSFRRQESLPLHLIYSSMAEDQGVVTADGTAEAMQTKKSEAKAERKNLSGNDISWQQHRKIQDVACSAQHSLSGQELEDSLRQERQQQLELLATLFPDGDDIVNQSRNEEIVEQASISDDAVRVVEDVDDFQVNTVLNDKEPFSARASSIPSSWDKLFEAAAGVGIASDISDSETSEHMVIDGPEDDGPATNSDAQKSPVKGPLTTKKVNWKDLQEGKMGRDDGPHVLQKQDDTRLDEGDEEVDASRVATINTTKHLMQDSRKRSAAVEKNPVLSLVASGAKRDVSDGPTGNLQGRGSIKKRKKEVAYANQSPEFQGVAEGTRNQANPGEPITERASDISGETMEGKWKRLFEAAEEGLQVAELEQMPEHDGTVVVAETSEHKQMESVAEPPGIQGETQEQKWKMMFEAAGGVEVPGKAPDFVRNSDEGDPAARRMSRRTSTGKSRSKMEDEGREDNGKTNRTEAEVSSNDSPVSIEPVSLLMLPQINFVTLDCLSGKASHTDCPEVNYGGHSSIIDPVLESETVSAAYKKAQDTIPPSEVPPTAAAPKVDETIKWMQKASWKSLVGEKGVAGFSLSSRFSPDLLLRQGPRDSMEQVPVIADKPGQQLVKVSRWRTANAVDKSVPKLTDAVPSTARDATEVAPPAEVSGDVCTFMRSETAYQDWMASKAKLKVDFKARHKAAKREIRRLRPPRKIILS